MLIHKEGLRKIQMWSNRSVWEYTFKYGENSVTLTFVVGKNEIPKTGDQVLHNKLVKQKADE